jgi:PAS domain S-box-containing protein
MVYMKKQMEIGLALQERIKELECLYKIGTEIEKQKNISQILLRSTEHIVKGFQFPEITFSVIHFDGKSFSRNAPNPSKIKKTLLTNIILNGIVRGMIEVDYTQEKEFLREEEDLIKEIARMIAKSIEKHELQEHHKQYLERLEDIVLEKTRDLEKSKERYENLFEYAPDAIVISQLNGDILKANKMFYKMLQYPEDGSFSLNYVKDHLYVGIEYLRPQLLERLEKEHCLEGIDFTLIDRFGDHVPVIGSLILIDFDGEMCIEAMFKDIKLRKESEDKLKEYSRSLEEMCRERTRSIEEQKDLLLRKNNELISTSEKLKETNKHLEALFSAITDTLILIDRDFNIKMTNKMKKKGVGKKCYEILFERERVCDVCVGEFVFKEKKPGIKELRVKDTYFQLHAYPIKNSRGEVDSVLGFYRDITKQKNLENQLYQADKLASLGQLVSGVAHEINNPNTFIKGNMSIIKEAIKDIIPILDDYYKNNNDLRIARLDYNVFKDNIEILINDMTGGTERIKTIVEDLRKFAKQDDGYLSDKIDINKLIQSSLRLVHNQIKRTAKMEIDLKDSIPLITGNGQRIEQVIINILINASQAIKDKGKITIKTSYDKKTKEISISISDNGCGMDEQTRKHIFDPFYTTKRGSGGTGLGSSIAYGIIEEHHGRIEVDSKKDIGTVFTVNLPIRTEG